MNRSELEEALQNKSSDDFASFVKDFGGDHKTPDTIIRDYIHHPEWEPRLCQLLGFLTEEERQTKAILQSAVSSKWSAIAAAVSAIIALLALLFTLWSVKGNQSRVQQITPAAQAQTQPSAPQPSVSRD